MLINEKKQLRKLYLSIRNGTDKKTKAESDKSITARFINSDFISRFDSFLIYVSVDNEVDTYGIIDFLLKRNKSVSVPYCDGNKMLFCKINSLNDLVIGRFGIPTVKKCDFIEENQIEKSLCVMPALSVDSDGNRLGYGGGFYDRFLNEYNVETVALCYEKCLSVRIPADKHDIKLKYILTENKFKKL